MILADELMLPGVRHGFLTRTDGGTTKLGLVALVLAKQKHTPDVVVVERAWTEDASPIADALVTNRPGLAVGVYTADCAPVLLADAEAGVVAASHAGWRGAFGGVIENTAAAMRTLGADLARIVAVVGPCIAQRSYEVGPEFVEHFTKADTKNACWFTAPKANGRVHFDLPGYVADRLRRAGIGQVVTQGSDTCADEALFFSYRRATQRGAKDNGRQLSVIGLTER